MRITYGLGDQVQELALECGLVVPPRRFNMRAQGDIDEAQARIFRGLNPDWWRLQEGNGEDEEESA